jgi:VWFA-related protein
MRSWWLAFALAVLPCLLMAQEELPSSPSSLVVKPAPAPPPAPKAEDKGGFQDLNPKKAQAQAQPAPAKPEDAAKTEPTTGLPAGEPGEAEGTTTIIVRAEEIPVIFTVTDKRGRFIKDLKQTDLRVIDDGRPAEAVRSFRQETDLPLRVGLVIDASNSIRERFKFEQEAAIEFLSTIVRPKQDRAFVLGFDSVWEVTQDFTDNTEKLANGVRMLRPGGGTALYDAIYYASRDKLLKLSEKGTVRKAIILLSDGEDNQSRVTREEAIEMALRAEVIVYPISTNVSGTVNKGDKVLERIAEATGGRAFFPFKIQDVANAFHDIQDELRSQYAISYKPANFLADGRYRTIEIEPANKKYRVRARKGYFAPKQ